jgi:exodeoxyribonuclease VII small subunit
MSFEEAMEKLSACSDKLAQKDLPLSEAIEAYRDGVKYYNVCNTILNEAEREVSRIDVDVEENR